MPVRTTVRMRAERRDARRWRREGRKLKVAPVLKKTPTTLDLATVEVACARAAVEKTGGDQKAVRRLDEAKIQCDRALRSLKAPRERHPEVVDHEETPLRPLNIVRGKTTDDVSEIVDFFKTEPVADQLRLIEFAVLETNAMDLPAIARAFALAYEDQGLTDDAFDDEALIALLEAHLRSVHVVKLPGPATLLRLLIRRKVNLRRALKCRTPATVVDRLKRLSSHVVVGSEKHRVAATTALHRLLTALLFGKP